MSGRIYLQDILFDRNKTSSQSTKNYCEILKEMQKYIISHYNIHHDLVFILIIFKISRSFGFILFCRGCRVSKWLPDHYSNKISATISLSLKSDWYAFLRLLTGRVVVKPFSPLNSVFSPPLHFLSIFILFPLLFY